MRIRRGCSVIIIALLRFRKRNWVSSPACGRECCPTGAIPGAPADFQSDLAAAFASVPEPGMALTMLEIWASGGLLGRRRRRMALL